MRRTSPVVSLAARVPINSVPLTLPSTLYDFPDFASVASKITTPVAVLNEALVNSIGCGVRNLPVSFPPASCRSSTVIASGVPPFGVQLPDQVPSSFVVCAVSAAEESSTAIKIITDFVFIRTSIQLSLRVTSVLCFKQNRKLPHLSGRVSHAIAARSLHVRRRDCV